MHQYSHFMHYFAVRCLLFLYFGEKKSSQLCEIVERKNK